ncbi:MAG TPA: cobyrinate a,c-diamide synthase [Candidatus Binataceae bacterium]|nr:cobyrinate a,c-diamide synthase [Candidatus Binataceae bacterium]
MASGTQIPRVVIGGGSSGAGKTTATVALIGALRGRGLTVAPFKCGPDYLDPSYHARAAGRTSHNLDGWMMGREAAIATFVRASRDADIAVIEGMMGLYDGATPTSEEGSTAEIAKWLGAPVLLTIDAGGIARSVGAIAGGFAGFDREVRLAGVLCNRVGGQGHLDLLRAASTEIPVVGGLPQNSAAAFPERHLGLFSADESNVPAESIEAWGRIAAEWFDLDAILAIARGTPALAPAEAEASLSRPARPRCRIGVAYDEAFHFYYEYNLALLQALGAEIERFSPAHDPELPRVDGLYFGGGYPEIAAPALSSNRAMLAAVRDFAHRGSPVYAECGGLMYLAEGIRALDGRSFPMAGVIPGQAVMRDRLQALGYAEVETRAPSMLGPAGTRWRGHQFRYSVLEPAPPLEFERLFTVVPRWGGEAFNEGYRTGNVVASYVHAHWASNPAVAAAFVSACASAQSRT